ncbi:MAG: glutathione peroxidase [Anaerolineaceae bacterium]|nr:glutathione peroxidase [Anaerolineaceae bacterium]
MSIYDFEVKNAQGFSTTLREYQGKVLLIVNTASKCGFTPQYTELQKLHENLHEKGLQILAFPCDQFAHQEPALDEEIQKFCQVNYGITFPVMGKIEVNGKHAHPLYQYLRKKKRGGLLGNSIKWNFTKFLVDNKGNVVKRFAPNVNPVDLTPEIEKLLT